MADLEAKIRGLIADAHGVSPEEVTPEFIATQRELLYNNPSHRFVDNREWLTVLTPAEIKAQEIMAQSFLAEMIKE